jgi:hypothetical protein
MDPHRCSPNNHHHDPSKDFLASLFATAPATMQQDHLQSFQPGAGPTSGPNLQSQLSMNMLNNMMQIQSVGENLAGMLGQGSQGSNVQFNPQAMFEQQFKLTQLQQLQQLQNQIFQQQVSYIFSLQGSLSRRWSDCLNFWTGLFSARTIGLAFQCALE